MNKSTLVTIVANALAATSVASTCQLPTRAESGKAAPENSSENLTPLQHNNLGVKLGNSGDWKSALREHETALKMDPNNPQFRTNLSAAHLEYAKWLVAHGKKADAATQFRQAMIIDPKNVQADTELDKMLRSLGKDPDSFDYRSGLAEAAERDGQYDTAIVEWRRCLKMRDSGLSRARLGRTLINAGKTFDGYNELTAAVGKADWSDEDKRELADIHRLLGDVLKELALKAKSQGFGTKGMQRLANAGIEYRRAVTLYPGNGPALEGLMQCGQMALAIKPSFNNHLFMGGAYVLAGKFANAIFEFKECDKLNPDSKELFDSWKSCYRAMAKSTLGKPELIAESIKASKPLIDAHPEDTDLWDTLGLLYQRQGDVEKAQKCFDKAKSIGQTASPLPPGDKK